MHYGRHVALADGDPQTCKCFVVMPEAGVSCVPDNRPMYTQHVDLFFISNGHQAFEDSFHHHLTKLSVPVEFPK